jgi:hypothetical protein
MKPGDLVCGKQKSNMHNIRNYIVGSHSEVRLLSYKFGLISKTRSKHEQDTIELWDPVQIKGMVVKVSKNINGHGICLAQVLLEKRLVWFSVDDLKPLKK